MKTHRWNPYLVGVLIGVLSILTFSLADKPIGISTGIAQAAGACAMPVIGAEGVAANTYWAKKAVPAWDYGSLFVLGTLPRCAGQRGGERQLQAGERARRSGASDLVPR
jgi:hypothetical protein